MKPKAKTARERIEALIDRYIPPAGMYLPENDANAAYLVGLRVALSCLPPTPPRRKGKKK